jgi:hypothetical protein
MALTQTQVSQLYVAIFNRASEGTGNTFWQSFDDAAAAASEMLATTDAKDYFGDNLDLNRDFIEHIYLNTLAKTIDDDPDGISFWVGQLEGGASRGEVVASLVAVIESYGPDGENYDPEDAATVAAYNQFTNRVEVSNYMAENVDNPPANYAQSTAFDQGLVVTDDETTVTSAKGAVEVLAEAEDNDDDVDDDNGTGDDDDEPPVGDDDDDLIEVDITDGSRVDAAGGDFQFNVLLEETDIYVANIANFSAGDVININAEFRDVENLLFDTTRTSEINFAFGDMDDFVPSFTLNLTGVDAALVAGVEAAADTAGVLGVLEAEWGTNWLLGVNDDEPPVGDDDVISVSMEDLEGLDDITAFNAGDGDYLFELDAAETLETWITGFDEGDTLSFTNTPTATAGDFNVTNPAFNDGEALVSVSGVDINLLGLDSDLFNNAGSFTGIYGIESLVFA